MAKTGLGNVSPETSKARWGDNLTLSIIPGVGQQIVDVRLNGNSVGAVTSYTLANIQADASIEAVFAQPGIPVHTLTSRVEGKGGTITPSAVRVTEGSNHRFVIIKQGKGEVSDVKVGDIHKMTSMGRPASYLFQGVRADSTVVATFNTPTAIQTPLPSTSYRITAGPGCITVVPTSETLTIRIYTTNGQNIFQGSIDRETNVKNLNPGIYIVEITLGTQSRTEKIAVREP